MTNAEIIAGEMIVAGLNPLEDVVDTFAGWKRKGYTVKKGEKSVFTTSIWKPSIKKAEVTEEETVEDNTPHTYLHLVKASFFTDKQVEKLEVK